ncbi:MAG: hypothetical protein AAF502_22620 [Bacteroidota bacterium]
MLKNKIHEIRLLAVAIFACLCMVSTTHAQVQLETLNVPSEVTMYSTMEISGTFKNTGTSVYFGPVGIDVEIMDNPGSSDSHFEPLFLTTQTLQPGEEYHFTQTVAVTPDKFAVNGYDIVIIYPLVVNINPQNSSPQTFSVFVRQSSALPGTATESTAKGAGN